MKYYLIGFILLISASVASGDNHGSGVRDGSKCFAIQQGSYQFDLICLFQLDILNN
jgi:hypothetical protein